MSFLSRAAGIDATSTQKKSPAEAGLFIAIRGREKIASLARYQKLRRGPMKYWVSLSTNFTSPLMPQVGLNFTWAPRRP